jgi:exosome complex exonuclease RRP6
MMRGLNGDEQQQQQVPLNSTSFDSYQAKLQLAALTATKQAFILPQDIQFHRTLDKSFGAEIDAVSARVFSLTDKLLRHAQGSSAKGKNKAILRTEDDLVEGYHLSIIDTIDQLYENAVSPRELLITLPRLTTIDVRIRYSTNYRAATVNQQSHFLDLQHLSHLSVEIFSITYSSA